MPLKIKRIKLKENKKSFILYPNYDDPNFNIKISNKKEFNEQKYDGEIKKVDTSNDCNKSFEIAPHQYFVRNFLSSNTPYNSLLLYHGLGTGKTCSAIGVCEEMREYMKQVAINQRIIIVASPTVQEEFKKQLFNERFLHKHGKEWNLEGCTGLKFLKEINPIKLEERSRETIIRQINRLISQYYIFMGYIEFSNWITNKLRINDKVQNKELVKKRRLIKLFQNRLIVIDEVHNIRDSDDVPSKQIINNLMKVVKEVDGVRLLLLSATPMYNNPNEIIWLLNLMMANDKRSLLSIKEVFDNEGNLLIDDKGNNIGEKLLIQKLRGYVSFVRGENPYLFPYRIFPKLFSKDSIKNIEYPKNTINNKEIIQPIQYTDIECVRIQREQEDIYNKITEELKSKKTIKTEDKFGYTQLLKPLEVLNICYPTDSLTGIEGLRSLMKYEEIKDPPQRFNYEVKEDYKEKYDDFFTLEKIKNYSCKIESIVNSIINTTGVVLVYSQYLEGGLVPLALTLETLGYSQYGSTKSLLKANPKSRSEKYIMITGDKFYSKNNAEAIKAATGIQNKDGDKIKIILISKAGSEGVDFKFIRQIHIMEPWYNLNRIEQIIGRGVRTCSHKALPLEKRNVQIFMYGTLLSRDEEAIDLYIYRLAEVKAVKIGKISRLIKKTAVDCIINDAMQNFDELSMNQTLDIVLANNNRIKYKVGDKPYSATCDYMENCNYQCNPNIKNKKIDLSTYNEDFILLKNEQIIQIIKDIFSEYYVLSRDQLFNLVKGQIKCSSDEINMSLNTLLELANYFLIDKYGRLGHLINIDNYYLFQPEELNNTHISYFERSRPLEYKKITLSFETNENKLLETKNELSIIDKIHSIVKIILSDKTPSRGEKNYYKYCQINMRKLSTQFDYNRSDIFTIIIYHIIDTLNFKDKLALINYLFYTENIKEDYLQIMKSYFDSQIMSSSGINGLYLINDKKVNLMIQGDKNWVTAQKTDKLALADSIEKWKEYNNLNKIIGFFISFKGTNLVFKSKDFEIKRSKGARCDQASKYSEFGVVTQINKLLGEETFTKENTKGISIVELCQYFELLLRLKEYKKEDNKTYFLSPEKAKLIEIESLKN